MLGCGFFFSPTPHFYAKSKDLHGRNTNSNLCTHTHTYAQQGSGIFNLLMSLAHNYQISLETSADSDLIIILHVCPCVIHEKLHIFPIVVYE